MLNWLPGVLILFEEDPTDEHRVVMGYDPETKTETGDYQEWFLGSGLYDRQNALVLPYHERATYFYTMLVGDWQFYIEGMGGKK